MATMRPSSRAGHPVRRALRRTLGSGPLVRGTDRLQLLSRAVALLATLVAIPVALVFAAGSRTDLEAVAAAQLRDRQQVDAVVLQDAPTRHPDVDGSEDAPPEFVRGSWSTPGGVPREGMIPVATGTRAGAVERIWINREGTPTTAPMDGEAVARTAETTGMGAFLGISVVAWGLHTVVRWSLDAHRARQWAADWVAVEPIWSAGLR